LGCTNTSRRRLAKLGAFAVVPDYYFRKGTDLTKITDTSQLLSIVNSKPEAELLSDLDSTVAWAKSQGGDTSRLGIIGFCRGGRTVWEYAAHSPTLKAAVAFCGPPVDPPNPLWPKSSTQLAPEMKAPVKATGGEQEDCRVQDLSGCAARFPRLLSCQLSQGSRRRREGADAGLVQEIRGTELSLSASKRAT
jgi:dienelactone hydrolase